MAVQESRLKSEQPQEQKSSGHYLSRASRGVEKGGEKLVKGFVKQRKRQLIYSRGIKEKKTYVKRAKGYYFKSKQSNPYIEFLKRRASQVGFAEDLTDAKTLFHDDWIALNVERQCFANSKTAGVSQAWEGQTATNNMERETRLFSHLLTPSPTVQVEQESFAHSFAGDASSMILGNEIEILSGLKTIQATRPKFARRKARRKKR